MAGIKELMEKSIKSGKPLHRSNAHTAIEIRGNFYEVWYYRTNIAIGKIGEMPFAFNLHGWTSTSTISRLRDLGFTLWSESMVTGQIINQKTHRKNKIRQSVMHINDKPMLVDDYTLDSNGKSSRKWDDNTYIWNKLCDYHSWWSADGRRIGD